MSFLDYEVSPYRYENLEASNHTFHFKLSGQETKED